VDLVSLHILLLTMAETNETAEPVDPISLALADIPALTSYPAVAEDERIAALRLIADSVAQQSQIGAKAIIFHPATLAAAVVVLAVVYKFLYTARNDVAIVATTWVGCVMAGLVAVRGATSGYLELAERTGTWAWLQEGRSQQHQDEEEEDDIILVTKYGTEIIGALVLRVERDRSRAVLKHHLSSSSTSSRKPTRPHRSGPNGRGASTAVSSSTPLGVIRAWTVKRRYRRKGIGASLLEEAVSVCRTKDWDGPVFADSHAMSARLLPRMFTSDFDQMERRACSMLDKVANQYRAEQA
jgi:hypothetical protein